jgi:hypothetical protein
MRIPRALTALALATLVIPAQSLFFYLDGTTPKCFFEELPKDTLVVGGYPFTPLHGMDLWPQKAVEYSLMRYIPRRPLFGRGI